MNIEDDNYYDEEPEREPRSEWDEWKEIDDARRYQEWRSDQRSPY